MSLNDDRFVTLAHGNGGRLMRALIEQVFARHLANPELNIQADAAILSLPPGEVHDDNGRLHRAAAGVSRRRHRFAGSAWHGQRSRRIGREPVYLTLNAFIEEGFELVLLDRLIASMARAAQRANVRVAAGDLKVLPRGEGGGLYLATTGIGVRTPGLRLGIDQVRPGDAVLVSGSVGDHGTSVLLAREQFGLRGDLASDSASVLAADAGAAGPAGTALHARPDARRACHRGARDRPCAGRDGAAVGTRYADPRSGAQRVRDAWV